MKVIFGIDDHSAYKAAMQLYSRFRFELPNAILAHFADPVPVFVPIEISGSVAVQDEYRRAVENIGRRALDYARDEACTRDIPSKSQLMFGRPAPGLIDLAEQFHADMVAVGAEQGSMWSTSFLGSVSRALAIGSKSSVLVAKGMDKETSRLKVVLATDHSEASQRAIRKFLSWKPDGIAEIHIVSAYELDEHEATILKKNLPGLATSVPGWMEDHIAGLNTKLAAQLTGAGYRVTTRVRRGNVNDVLRQTMQDVQADVLVRGAQGHGFVERMLVGSTALHQVVAEPYPVLVVRA